jgi:hypothetical protein
MVVKLDHRGWTADQWIAPCVICHSPAILRSPRGRPCHWGCAVTWVNGHEDQADARQEPHPITPFRSGGVVI